MALPRLCGIVALLAASMTAPATTAQELVMAPHEEWTRRISGATGDELGHKVVTYGSSALLAAPKQASCNCGTVYFYERSVDDPTDASQWEYAFQANGLGQEGSIANANFGTSVALDSDGAGGLIAGTMRTKPWAVFIYTRAAGAEPGDWILNDGPLDVPGASSTNDAVGDLVLRDRLAFAGVPRIDSNRGAVFVYGPTVPTDVTQPWEYKDKLQAATAADGTHFGWVLATNPFSDMGVLMVNDYYADTAAATASGAVHVYAPTSEKTSPDGLDADWAHVTRIDPPTDDPVAVVDTDARFGTALALEGNLLVVGAYRAEPAGGSGLTETGAVFLFVASGTNYTTAEWTYAGPALEALVPETDGKFGVSVALAGRVLIVGSIAATLGGRLDMLVSAGDPAMTNSSLQWAPAGPRTWEPPDGAALAGDYFGVLHKAVALGAGFALVGAPRADDEGTDGGAVWHVAFNHEHVAWLPPLNATLGPGGAVGEAGDKFGNAVALSANGILAVGALERNAAEGAVYLFKRPVDAGPDNPIADWVAGNDHEVVAPDGAAGDKFGYSVAMSDDSLVVGAPHADSSGGGSEADSGAAYAIRITSGGTRDGSVAVQRLEAATPTTDGLFGRAVAIQDDTIVVGAPGDNSELVEIFVRLSGSTLWTHATTFASPTHGHCSNPDPGAFGNRVALDVSVPGRRLVVASDSGWGNCGKTSMGRSVVLVSTGPTTTAATEWSSHAWQELATADITAWELRADGRTVAEPGEYSGELQHRSYFGDSVAVYGEWAFAGGPGSDKNGEHSGAVHVYRASDPDDLTQAWTNVQALRPSDHTSYNMFGRGLDVVVQVGSGTTADPSVMALVVGSATQSYAFVRDDTDNDQDMLWRQVGATGHAVHDRRLSAHDYAWVNNADPSSSVAAQVLNDTLVAVLGVTAESHGGTATDAGIVTTAVMPVPDPPRHVCAGHVPAGAVSSCAELIPALPASGSDVHINAATLAAGWRVSDEGGSPAVDYTVPVVLRPPSDGDTHVLSSAALSGVDMEMKAATDESSGDPDDVPAIALPRPFDLPPQPDSLLRLTGVRVLSPEAVDSEAGAATVTSGGIAELSTDSGPGAYALTRCELAGATALRGGALFVSGVAVSMDGCNVTSNTAQIGGALYVTEEAAVTVTDGVLTNNTATLADGGAVYVAEFASVTVSGAGSVISDNSAADSGGGVYVGFAATFTSEGSATFEHNTAFGGRGGGLMAAAGSGQVSVTDSTFVDCEAAVGGGGIAAAAQASVDVVDSVFRGNIAGAVAGQTTAEPGDGTGLGGALWADGGATVEVNGLSVEDNVAQFRGGGLACTEGGVLSVHTSAITRNAATSCGGGLSVDDCVTTLDSDVELVNNTVDAATPSSFEVGGGAMCVRATDSEDAARGRTVVGDVTFSGNAAPTGGAVLAVADVLDPECVESAAACAERGETTDAGAWLHFSASTVFGPHNDATRGDHLAWVHRTVRGVGIVQVADYSGGGIRSVGGPTALKVVVQPSTVSSGGLWRNGSVVTTVRIIDEAGNAVIVDEGSAVRATGVAPGVTSVAGALAAVSQLDGTAEFDDLSVIASVGENVSVVFSLEPAQGVAPVAAWVLVAGCEAGYEPSESGSSCVECPIGSFSTNGTICEPCVPGTYADAPGLAACKSPAATFVASGWRATQQLQCEAGKVPNAHASECITCATGTVSAAGAASCRACDPGFAPDDLARPAACVACLARQRSNGTACEDCDPNTEQDPANPAECRECDGGEARQGDAELGCSPCGVGGHRPVNWTGACLPCPIGRFASDAGQAECSEPPSGWVVAGGGTTVVECPAGQFAPNATHCVECGQGLVSDAGASSCLECLPGYFEDPGSNICSTCAAATYASNGTLSECLPCAAGSGTPGGAGATRCVPCSDGEEVVGGDCVPCDARTYSVPGVTDGCIPCPAGEVAPARSGSCFSCAVGQEPNLAGDGCVDCGATEVSPDGEECTPCGDGSEPDRDQGECDLCPFGTESVGGAACSDCGLGKYADEEGLDACKTCPLGRFADVSGLEECRVPDAGHIVVGTSAQQSCAAGQFAKTATECEACGQGYVSDAGASSCLACQPGEAETPGTNTCSQCRPGEYAPAGNLTACLTCGQGFTSQAGARECDECKPGSYEISGTNTCTECAVGRFAPNGTLSECPPCPGGWGTPFGKGAAVCTPCGDGSEPDDGSCVTCASGFYSKNGVTEGCMACPPGSVSGPGAVACSACGAGWAPNTDATECMRCDANEASPHGVACAQCDDGFAPNGDGSRCDMCPSGTAGDAPINSRCEPCSKGFAQSEPGSTTCTRCPRGSYTDALGEVRCSLPLLGYVAEGDPAFGGDGAVAQRRCEQGTAPADNSTVCEPCAAGMASTGGQTECTGCHPGTAALGELPGSCSPCPPGTFTNVSLSVQCRDCPAGTYAESEGTPNCAECPVGRYSAESRVASGTDCRECGSGLTTLDVGSTAQAQCVAQAGWVLIELNSVDGGGAAAAGDARAQDGAPVVVARRCTEGTLCAGGGDTLDKLRVEPGFWRAGPTSSEVRSCPNPEFCVGGVAPDDVIADAKAAAVARTAEASGANAGAAAGAFFAMSAASKGALVNQPWLCVEGHTGPVCQLCIDGWANSGPGTACQKCPDDIRPLLLAFGTVLLGVVLVALLCSRAAIEFKDALNKAPDEVSAAIQRSATAASARLASHSGSGSGKPDAGAADGEMKGADPEAPGRRRSSAAAVAVAVAATVHMRQAARRTASQRALEAELEWTEKDQRDLASIGPKTRIIVSMCQVIATLPVTLSHISLPPMWLNYAHWWSWANLELFGTLAPTCVLPTDHYSRLLMATLFPLGLAVLLALVVRLQLSRPSVARSADRAKWWRTNGHYAFLLLTFTVFPGTSNRIFATYSCDDFGTGDHHTDPTTGATYHDTNSAGRYLKVDYSVDCDTDSRDAWLVYATAMMMLYSVCIPLYYLGELLWRRHRINPSMAALNHHDTAKGADAAGRRDSGRSNSVSPVDVAGNAHAHSNGDGDGRRISTAGDDADAVEAAVLAAIAGDDDGGASVISPPTSPARADTTPGAGAHAGGGGPIDGDDRDSGVHRSNTWVAGGEAAEPAHRLQAAVAGLNAGRGGTAAAGRDTRASVSKDAAALSMQDKGDAAADAAGLRPGAVLAREDLLGVLTMHEALAIRDDDDSIAQFTFLFEDFKPRYYLMEVFLIAIKLCLTGFAVIFMPGSASQIVFSMVALMASTAMLAATRPYLDPSDTDLALLVNWSLLLTLLAAMLVQLGVPTTDGYDEDLFGMAMVAIVSFVIVVWAHAALTVLRQTYSGVTRAYKHVRRVHPEVPHFSRQMLVHVLHRAYGDVGASSAVVSAHVAAPPVQGGGSGGGGGGHKGAGMSPVQARARPAGVTDGGNGHGGELRSIDGSDDDDGADDDEYAEVTGNPFAAPASAGAGAGRGAVAGARGPLAAVGTAESAALRSPASVSDVHASLGSFTSGRPSNATDPEEAKAVPYHGTAGPGGSRTLQPLAPLHGTPSGARRTPPGTAGSDSGGSELQAHQMAMSARLLAIGSDDEHGESL